MRKMLGAAVVLALAGLTFAAARPGILRTNDGVVYDGTVDESAESAVVNVRGIETTVARSNIASITYGDFEERWKETYGKLNPKDAAGRVLLGRHAFDQGRYDLAEQALRDAMAIDPNNADAAELLKLTINQRRLERNQPDQPKPTISSAPVELNGAMKPAGAWATLTPQQINRVKQMELREGDTSARFAFDNDVRKKFYETNPQLNNTYRSYGDFLKDTPLSQAMQIIKAGDEEMVKDVRIVNDPASIVTFRREVLPLVLQGCATSGCHGGNNAAADKFAMITPALDPAAVYTNFYILSSTSVKQMPKTSSTGISVVSSDTAPMFDRAHPEASGLLQYGLPELVAEAKHPRTRGFNGIFRSRDDERYQTVLKFVNSLSPVSPDYGFKFKLERAGLPDVKNPATLPAGAP